MHIDISPASLPPFPVFVFGFCFFLLPWLLLASPPLPLTTLPTILVCTHTLFLPRGFDECDGGHREKTSLGELALGWHQKRERKIEDTPPDSRLYYVYLQRQRGATT